MHIKTGAKLRKQGRGFKPETNFVLPASAASGEEGPDIFHLKVRI
ncbi:MAG: hypothetical protein V5783_00610 [Pontiella sp.]